MWILLSSLWLLFFGYYSSILLIDVCCFFGSLKCFKYLLLNKCEITEFTLKSSIAGGNQEIINILKERQYSFEECLETSVKYHRYELINWLNENYKCKQFPLTRCIEYYNIDAFLYFLEHGYSLDETDEYGRTCLHQKVINKKLLFMLHVKKVIFQLCNILLKKVLILKQKKLLIFSKKQQQI